MPNFKMPPSFIALLVAAAASANAQDPAIQKKLISEYAITQPTADLTDIVTAGAILVLQKSNLMLAPATSSNLYQNTYKDGKIQQNAFGKSKSFLGKMGRVPGLSSIPGVSSAAGAAGSADAASGPAPRTYVTGEKVWVTKIEVKSDGVVLDLFTDAVADVRYKGSLTIPIGKGVTPDQVDKLVAEVFKVQPAEDAKQDQAPAGGQQQQSAPPAAPAAPEAAPPPIAPPPPPADTAVPDIAPPPPPTDQPTQTISLGQTPDQVTAILGQPQKIVKLAAKQTYYYKDLKVIFTGGKVTDVQ